MLKKINTNTEILSSANLKKKKKNITELEWRNVINLLFPVSKHLQSFSLL